MSKNKFNPAILIAIALVLFFIFMLLTEVFGTFIELIFNGYPPIINFISKICVIVAAVLFVLGIILSGIQAKKNPRYQNNSKYGEDYNNLKYRKKNGDFKSNRATAEFIAAHKQEDGTYSIEYEYEKESGESFVEQYDGEYSYIEAKYFQKIRRFTVAYGENSSKIIDQPRPGIIPELAGMPVVSKTPANAPKKTETKPLKEENELRRIFCPYCDCMIKSNSKSNKCPHCGAPVRK